MGAGGGFDSGEFTGEGAWAFLPGSEVGGFFDRGIPMRGPDSVGVAGTRGPGEHGVRKLDTDVVTQFFEVDTGSAKEVSAVDHEGGLALLLGQPIEQRGLLGEADVVQGDGFAAAGVGE